MSDMRTWARREVEIVSKEENAYVAACCQSALKAFESICEDGHSGMSISCTKNILVRLIEGKPLTPITEENADWVKIANTEYQSRRMSSLFKTIKSDGSIEYRDINRVVGTYKDSNICFYNGCICRVIDELYPITLPYYPTKGYKVIVEEFLFDEKNGDFDTMGIISAIDPDGKELPINKYFKEYSRSFVEISAEEYEERKSVSEGRK